MKPAPGWQEQDGMVTITVTHDDWNLLLLSMGMAMAAMRDMDRDRFWSIVELVNGMNRGNPDFTPFRIERSV